MTYQSFPSNLQIDLGRDGSTEWNMSGELQTEIRLTELEDALTDYIQEPTHYPDEEGYLTIPIYVYSKTPGTLRLSDLDILFNNASRKPQLVFPVGLALRRSRRSSGPGVSTNSRALR